MHANASNEPNPARTVHASLTHSLHALRDSASHAEGITLNEILTRNGGRGGYLLMIVLCLPFISPIPVPGLSNVVGVIISWLAVHMVFTHSPTLPRFLGDRRLSRKSSDRLIKGSVRVVNFLERLTRRRYAILFGLKPVELGTLTGIFVLGLLLALPIPPVIPFSNSLPAWGIILISLATMALDGVLIWIGYAIGLGAVAYLAVFAGAIWKSVAEIWEYAAKLFT